MKKQNLKGKPAAQSALGAAGCSVCRGPALPATWGKVEVPPGMVMRPLTEKDLKGYSKEEWQQIVESEKGRKQNIEVDRRSPIYPGTLS